MSKRKNDGTASRAGADLGGAIARSLSLTLEERLLVAAILLSILLGTCVMHWRREYKVRHPAEFQSPSPSPVSRKSHRSTGARWPTASP